jgi:hypothetical protein
MNMRSSYGAKQNDRIPQFLSVISHLAEFLSHPQHMYSFVGEQNVKKDWKFINHAGGRQIALT